MDKYDVVIVGAGAGAKHVVHPFPTYSEILEIPLWELATQVTGRPTQPAMGPE